MANKADTTWFKEAKWGAFFHYLAEDKLTADEWNRQVDAFNVEKLAAQLEEARAPYMFITLGQNSGHYCTPNAAYDSFVGITPSKCSERDLVNDLYDALAPKGIKLMLYLPSGAPDRDLIAMEKLKWKNNAGRLAEFQTMWEEVVREWSVRYGKKIGGWWIDGCYFAGKMYNHPEAPNFKSFSQALKAGNPDSLVAFNPGVMIPVESMTEYEDFTAGEISENFPLGNWYTDDGSLKFIDNPENNVLLQILTFTGKKWGSPELRFPDELVIGYTKFINNIGGIVTWDANIQTGGTIHPDALRQLIALGKAIER